MAMPEDFRIKLEFADHPKLTDLEALCAPLPAGQSACRCLLRLWSFCMRHDRMRRDGVLRGMDSLTIERRAGWTGTPHVFFDALRCTKFLDKKGHWFALHDWKVHQEWVGVWERRCCANLEIARQREGLKRTNYINDYSNCAAQKTSSDASRSALKIAPEKRAESVNGFTAKSSTATSGAPATGTGATHINSSQFNSLHDSIKSVQSGTAIWNGDNFKTKANSENGGSNPDDVGWKLLAAALNAFGWQSDAIPLVVAIAQREFRFPEIENIHFRRFVALCRYVIRTGKTKPLAYVQTALRKTLIEPADMDLDAAKSEFLRLWNGTPAHAR